MGNLSGLDIRIGKEYLEGIFDQITVTLNNDLLDSLVIRIQRPIVGDSHE